MQRVPLSPHHCQRLLHLLSSWYEVRVIPHCGSDLLFPDDTEHLFIYLLAIRTAFLKYVSSDPLPSHFTCVQLFVTPRTVAHQAPLSMGILQARTLEWVATSFSRGSSQPRDWAHISQVSPAVAGRLFTQPRDWAHISQVSPALAGRLFTTSAAFRSYAHFFSQIIWLVFFFLLLNCISFSHILDINLLSDIWFAYISSHLQAVFFLWLVPFLYGGFYFDTILLV